jgi:hypothetical protein
MLISLANVKAFKNITEHQHDDELSRLIPVVQAFIETYCERAFEQQAGIVEYHSTDPGQTRVLLRRPPVSVVTTIHDDPARVYGSSTVVAAADYVLTNAEAGIVTFVQARGSGGVSNLKVVYTGGYAAGSDTLALIEQAALELMWLARDKGDMALLGLSTKSIADSSMTFRNDWPAGVQTILDLHHLRHG